MHLHACAEAATNFSFRNFIPVDVKLMRRLENTQIRFLYFAEKQQNTLKGLKIDVARRNTNKPTHKCSVLLCVAVCSSSLCVCVLLG